jgi:hypothetical protein
MRHATRVKVVGEISRLHRMSRKGDSGTALPKGHVRVRR